ncbi:hypothetical protein U0070_013612 [Myodes glareolus]|uniref:Large ribosomal subunit protein eL38 n=1 Tax=Myodes glareolus TaxID=447135 RepID=A0AAW0JNZ6_MYOGA
MEDCSPQVRSSGSSAIAMPQKIEKIKDFLLTAQWKDAKSVKIKKNKDNVKFKFTATVPLYPGHHREGEN